MSTVLLRHDSDHLRVFFIIYAIFFAQGLMRMVEQVYRQPHLTSIVASASLALIGLRLLFSSRTWGLRIIFPDLSRSVCVG
jgi:hypothetical protein